MLTLLSVHNHRSESPSQVFIILVQWLLSLQELYGSSTDMPTVLLAYDSTCNLAKMHAAKTPLPLSPPLDQLWMNVIKIIDSFHLRNHVSPACKELFSPAPYKATHPYLNTQAGEQTFTWLQRFKFILSAMPKAHHLFYLHRMVLRRNMYTSKCYKNGKKPVLPKACHQFTTKTSLLTVYMHNIILS